MSNPLTAPSITRVLLVEDDPRVSKPLDRFLSQHGYSVYVTATLSDASVVLAENELDAVLLDLVLPDRNGLAFLSEIRTTNGRIPVLIISGLDSDVLQITALELGACDYIAKPFSPPLALARLRACLRSARAGTDVLRALDQHGRILSDGVTTVRLSKMEAAILAKLAREPRTRRTRQDLLDSWPEGMRPKLRSVDFYIHGIRQKLQLLGRAACIRTERNGYSCDLHLQFPNGASTADSD